MATVTAQAGETSRPFFVPPGTVVTVTPSAGATALVEYTTSGRSAVRNGVAKWQSWFKGTVSAPTTDILNSPADVRLTATGGSVTISTDETPLESTLTPLRSDWGGTLRMPFVVAQSAVAVSVTGTLTETTLATITIPGGMMGPNGVLRIATLWSYTSSTNSKTLKLKFGSNAIWSAVLSTASVSLQNVATVRNRGSNSQIVGGPSSTGTGVSTNPALVLSTDTSADTVVLITGQLGTSSESITLEGYTVEVLPS